MSSSKNTNKNSKLKIVSTEQRIEGRDFPGKRQSEGCGCFDNSEVLKAMETEECSAKKKKQNG